MDYEMEQLDLFDTWCGKMSMGVEVAPTATTLDASSKKSLGLSANQSPYLKCLKVGGPNGEQSQTLTDDGKLLGALWTHNTQEGLSESEIVEMLWNSVRRSAARGSVLLPTSEAELQQRFVSEKAILTDILEENADDKYKLSARACQGIINRAERRGKKLPDVLETALHQTIENETKYSDEVKLAIDLCREVIVHGLDTNPFRIVFQDDNIEDDCIQFCKEAGQSLFNIEYREICVKCADALLAVSEDKRLMCIERAYREVEGNDEV